jgi:hypothetical protein
VQAALSLVDAFAIPTEVANAPVLDGTWETRMA